MKRCCDCKLQKNESEFYKYKHSFDKLDYYCKKCKNNRVNARRKLRYNTDNSYKMRIKNKNKLLYEKYSKKWYENKKTRIKNSTSKQLKDVVN